MPSGEVFNKDHINEASDHKLNYASDEIIEPRKKVPYLDTILEQNDELPEGEAYEATKRLNTPSSDTEHSESGVTTIKTKTFDYQFSVEPIPSDLRNKVKEFIKTLQHEAEKNDFRLKSDDNLFQESRWKRLSLLTISSSDRRNMVNIFDIMPSHYDIFIGPRGSEMTGALMLDDKSIFIYNGALAAPMLLLIILHEIGHTWDDHNISAGVTKEIDEGEHQDLAEILRKERTATAFALKAVRSFTRPGDLLRSDALLDAKHYALESYVEYARQKIKAREDMVPILRVIAKDYDGLDQELSEQERWDEFSAWKQSDEYEVWKNMDEHKNIEDWEEYGLWQVWCEKTGKAWWMKPGDND